MRQRWIATVLSFLTATSLASAQQLPAKDKIEAETPAPCVEACEPDCCVPDLCCGEPCQERFWASTEYLLFWFREQNIPGPLAVTAGPGPGGFAPLSPDNFNYGANSGVRINAGTWFRRNPRLGFMASGFLMEQANAGFSVIDPTGTLPIGQPFVGPGFVGAVPASAPGILGGGVILSATNRVWGSEANFVGQVVDNNRWNLSLLGGFRYIDLTESLDMNSPAVSLTGGPGFPVGTFSNFLDTFDTRNQFYGGQLGGRLEYRRNRVFINSTAKLALGNTHQSVDTLGNFFVAPPGGPAAIFPAGAYVFPGFNYGHFTSDRFSIIPELQLNVGYQFNRYLNAFVGYNFLYWTDVQRPADQINPVQVLPGLPNVPQNSTDFWMHGLNCGLGVRF